MCPPFGKFNTLSTPSGQGIFLTLITRPAWDTTDQGSNRVLVSPPAVPYDAKDRCVSLGTEERQSRNQLSEATVSGDLRVGA